MTTEKVGRQHIHNLVLDTRLKPSSSRRHMRNSSPISMMRCVLCMSASLLKSKTHSWA